MNRKIHEDTPHGEKAVKIIAEYEKSKLVGDGVDPAVIAKIMDERSCAELETVINEAGLYAGYERAESITMDHFLKACLRTVFHIVYDDRSDFEDEQDDCSRRLSDPDHTISQVILHEEGHAVGSEVLYPEGVQLCSAGYTSGGFVVITTAS